MACCRECLQYCGTLDSFCDGLSRVVVHNHQNVPWKSVICVAVYRSGPQTMCAVFPFCKAIPTG